MIYLNTLPSILTTYVLGSWDSTVSAVLCGLNSPGVNSWQE